MKGYTIPNTGKRGFRWSFGWCYKTPKTKNELKKSHDKDIKNLIRGKRSCRNIPNTFWDTPQTQPKKSWKRYIKGRRHCRNIKASWKYFEY